MTPSDKKGGEKLEEKTYILIEQKSDFYFLVYALNLLSHRLLVHINSTH